MFVINAGCETVLNVFHLNHSLLITSFSVYESKVVYTCLWKDLSCWSSSITSDGATACLSAQTLSAVPTGNCRKLGSEHCYVKYYFLKYVVFTSLASLFVFPFFLFFLVLQTEYQKISEISTEGQGGNLRATTATCQRRHIGGIFADVLYQCITSSSENYKKCMHYPQGIFAFLKVQNALSLSKRRALFPLDW